MNPIPTPPKPCHQPKRGDKYWTVAAWTAKGTRPEQAQWTGCMIDRLRRTRGEVFPDEKAARAYLQT